MRGQMLKLCAAILAALPFFVILPPSRRAHAQTGKPAKAQSFVPGRVLVHFSADVGSARAQQSIAAAGGLKGKEIPHTGVYAVQLPPTADEEAFANAFRNRPGVTFAELDSVVAPQDITPNDPSYPSEWHLSKISAPAAWSTTTGSSTVTIAILDTGVDGTHPDLAPKMVPGWNFYDNNADTSDVYGHGTAVAGTAAASSNNGSGVASIAWNCMIMPVRISDPSGFGSVSAIANGLTWAADHGARVANISYQVTGYPTISTAAKYFQSKGGVVTVAAGNGGVFDATAADPYMVTVSATDSSNALASFSNTGNAVDIAAPGVSIYTTNKGGGYGSWSGTSFSAPIAAGAAALVLSSNPSLTGAQAQDALIKSANDLGPAGWDTAFGAGCLNVSRAVSAASGLSSGTTDTTAPTVSFTNPTNGSVASGTVAVQVSASDNVGVSSVSFSVDSTALGSDTAAPYNFTWNTSGVSNGTHTLSTTARDAAGNSSTSTILVSVSNIGDTSSPVVSITSPGNGGMLTANVTVTVSVGDNIGVVRNELYVDGTLAASSTSAPFTTKWATKKATKGPHTLQCKAYDAAGNVGLSQVVTEYK